MIAENHIRRLKNQVREGRDKVLISKPRSIQMEANKGGYFSDFSEIKQKKNRSIPVRRSSEDIFVGDSNLSLETMGAYRQRERVRQQERNSHRSPSLSPYGDKEGIGNDIRDKVDRHPSELYLRGALWLGRNITMVIEDLAEALDFFRSRFLSEVKMLKVILFITIIPIYFIYSSLLHLFLFITFIPLYCIYSSSLDHPFVEFSYFLNLQNFFICIL